MPVPELIHKKIDFYCNKCDYFTGNSYCGIPLCRKSIADCCTSYEYVFNNKYLLCSNSSLSFLSVYDVELREYYKDMIKGNPTVVEAFKKGIDFIPLNCPFEFEVKMYEEAIKKEKV